MKEKVLLLVFFCVVGFGACLFAQKNGPLPIVPRSSVNNPPPGWTPAPPQTNPVQPTPPVQPPSKPKQQQPG